MKYVDNLSPTDNHIVNVLAIMIVLVVSLLVCFWIWQAAQRNELYRECLKLAEKNPAIYCRNY